MNQQAAKELMQCMMPEDFVQRRDALNNWSRKWCTTLHVEFTHDGTQPDSVVWPVAKEVLTRKIFEGLMADSVNVMLWGKLVGDDNSFACEMHVIKQKP